MLCDDVIVQVLLINEHTAPLAAGLPAPLPVDMSAVRNVAVIGGMGGCGAASCWGPRDAL